MTIFTNTSSKQRTERRIAAVGLVLAAGLVLAGCSAGNGTPAQSGHSGHQSQAPSSGAGHNAADTAFARNMIVHHQQAVDMSETMLAKKDLPQSVTALAERIKAAQGPEIATMTSWLKGWGEPVEMPGGHGGHTMEGMLGEEDLAALDAAQGKAAAKLFLQQMTEHHEGALAMAKEEQAKGKDAGAVALAKEIITAQEAEVKEMKALLSGLG
ncbi:hypothetical protein BIU82_05910 [Arthrobacter sp. SW1]|uniref:DUF305 domain-containing protein n=1 Tax=Arthrobacter sp. SW1 TaxID=1920889 RepID=UPI000877B4E9|nr:DUF305 domain-containing protein [Arthrobacter sp. SW1]OFI38037.1 hypothetical protein BIU82_05910 [Arthrobacter sp. SW1]